MNQEAYNLSDSINFQQEFNDILSFVAEICEVPCAFISHINYKTPSIISKIGFDSSTIPENLLTYNKIIIEKNSIFKISGITKYHSKKIKNSDLTFDFFLGIPISNDENIAIGTLCVMDLTTKEFSPVQLKTLEHSAHQIQSFLKLRKKNNELQKVLEIEENQFQIAATNSKEMLYKLNENGTIIYVSKNWKTFLGYEVDEVIGKNNTSFLHPEDMGKVLDFLEDMVVTGNNKNEITYRILHKEGYYVWHASTVSLSEKDGEIIYIGICRDITEYIEARYKLLQQKEFYEKILDKIPTDIAVFDSKHNYLYLNPFAIKDKELRKFILGKNDFEYAKHIGRNTISAQKRRVKFLEATLSKNLTQWEEKYVGVTGETTYHTRKFNPVFLDDGSLDIMVGFGVDITEIKKAQEEILKSKQLLNSILENVAVGIIVQGPRSEFLEYNKAACEMLGLTEDQMLGKTSFDDHWKVIHLDGKEFLANEYPVPMAIKQRKPIKKIVMGVFRPMTNDRVWLLVDAIPVFDEKRKLLYVVCSFNDITELKKLEDELRQSEAQFKGAFEHSPVGMALINVDGYYIEVNERLCEILGYTNQELKSLTFQELTYSEDLEIDLVYKQDLDLGKIANFSSEKRFIKKDKSYVWTHISVSLVKKSENETYYIVQIIDITERKKIENQNKLLIEENNKNRAIQLNEAKNRYRFLAENSVDLICLHTLDTAFQYVSPSVVNILGYNPEYMEGKSPLDFAHPEDLRYLEDSFTDFIDEKVNGTTIARFRNNKGKYIWLETKANIIKEKDIKTGFQSSSRDITTRKEEEEIIEKTLIKERELNELRSNLVSTVSHEFRTPMTTIRTSAELISIYLIGQTFEKKQRLEKQLSTITGEIDRIVELMNSVLTISRNDAGKTIFNPIQFDLKQLCIDVIETSYNNQKDGRKVKTFFKGTNFVVFADKNLMEYSIFNLLNNAFKYSQGCEDIIVNISTTSSKVVLEIIDFGIGIPNEDQPKLFNTFFRASNTNGIPGTGLGLYIVKTFTEKNSGTIQFESILGKGTKVKLTFPLQKP